MIEKEILKRINKGEQLTQFELEVLADNYSVSEVETRIDEIIGLAIKCVVIELEREYFAIVVLGDDDMYNQPMRVEPGIIENRVWVALDE